MINYVFHVWHGGGQQGAAENGFGSLIHGIFELVYIAVDPQVDDLVSGTLEHDRHQIFSDVVKISLDGTNADRRGGLMSALNQEGFYYVQACLHCPGGYQHVRNIGIIAGEPVSHFPHCRNHGVIEKFSWFGASGQGFVDYGFH